MRHALLAALLLLPALPVDAAPTVRHVAASRLFFLETARTSYVLGVNEKEELQQIYWGDRLTRDADLGPAHTVEGHSSFDPPEGLSPVEYPGFGGARYAEPALKVTFADGVRDLVLKVVSHEVRENALLVRLKDVSLDLRVELTYRVFPAHDVLMRQVVVENQTKGVVVVESAQSATWHVPRWTGYRLTHLAGRWAGETQLFREALGPGRKVVESRRGTTSNHQNPFFAVDPGTSDEEHGPVVFGALAWSGNWRISLERTSEDRLRVTGGMNDFDFSYPLPPGGRLETPPFYAGFTSGGFGEASRILHRFVREQILPDRASPRPRPVLYNSWEATLFDVNEEGQKRLADKAAALGAEMFVMDDGWFGARKDDHAGLGDWTVNARKFPRGLGPLIEHVHGLGMKFGLWVEPEMVNPDSDLYRAHPDWVIHFPGRPRTEARNQLILNMARDDVKEHVFAVLDRLLTDNAIDFLKWDMNRHVSEPGWPALAPAEQRTLWVRYPRNVYELIDRLRARHPKLEIESCSGGGGRVDLGILARVDQVWPSDNTEAFDRLRIQEGTSFAYPAKVMMDWVTDVPNMNGRRTPLDFRFHVAMMGSLGIGGNLDKWSEADMKLGAGKVALYKSIRATVQDGRLFRLASPREGSLTSNQYVSADGGQAVVFAFLHAQQLNRPAPVVRLRGLDPAATYRLRTVDDKLPGTPAELSGSALMGRGLQFRLTGDFDSTVVVLERVAGGA